MKRDVGLAPDTPAEPLAESIGWSQIRPLLGSRRRSVAALAVGSISSGLTESAILAALAEAAAALVNSKSRVYLDIGSAHLTLSLGTLLGAVIGLAILRLALQWLVSYYPALIAADLRAQVSAELFASFTRASWQAQSRDKEGQLQELATNQVTQAIIGALQATNLVLAVLTFTVLVASALILNVLAALLVAGTAAGLFALLKPLSNLGARKAQATSLAALRYAGGINEAVRLAEETHVFGTAAAQRQRIERLIEEVREPFLYAQMLIRLAPGIYQSAIFLFVGIALLALYASGTSQVASLGAVVLLLVRASSYGQAAQSAYQGVRQAAPYLERVRETQRRYLENSAARGERALSQVKCIAFRAVSFSYEQARPVLDDISFDVAAGETIGIVGPSGAGKSTIVQILLGLRGPDSGAYLINGLPADEFRAADWHRAVAYLPQQPRLLHASVRDNIRYFRALDNAAVERAARLAGIHDEVVRWPDRYDTLVGPRADAISGGQQQRICMARALAAEPQVLVLDEPTSALDPGSEHLIQKSLVAIRSGLTLFIVAHRMSTLDICHRVMVIVNGRLQAFDSVSDLERTNSYYNTAAALAAGPFSDSH